MFLFWTALIVAIDQATKLWAKSTFVPGGPEMVVGLGFSFTYVRNPGAAFGLFRSLSIPIGPVTLDGTLLLGLVSAAVALTIGIYLARNAHAVPPIMAAALTLILSGALGNMIDRLWRGFVVDFIHFQQGSFDFAVFNVADSAVVAGAGLLMLAAFLPSATHRPLPDVAAEAATEPTLAPERTATGHDRSEHEGSEHDAPTAPPRSEPVPSSSRFDRTPEHSRELVEPDLDVLEREPRR